MPNANQAAIGHAVVRGSVFDRQDVRLGRHRSLPVRGGVDGAKVANRSIDEYTNMAYIQNHIGRTASVDRLGVKANIRILQLERSRAVVAADRVNQYPPGIVVLHPELHKVDSHFNFEFIEVGLREAKLVGPLVQDPVAVPSSLSRPSVHYGAGDGIAIQDAEGRTVEAEKIAIAGVSKAYNLGRTGNSCREGCREASLNAVSCAAAHPFYGGVNTTARAIRSRLEPKPASISVHGGRVCSCCGSDIGVEPMSEIDLQYRRRIHYRGVCK